MSKYIKRTCFLELVKFLNSLKEEESCDLVIHGGDFNLSAEKARDEMGSIDGVEGIVAIEDTITTDGQRRDIIRSLDYIVYWPRGSMHDF